MISFSCDRCKQPVERGVNEKALAELDDLPQGIKVYGRFHLCNECSGKLHSFITEPELWHKSVYE